MDQGWIQIDVDCAADSTDSLAAELADRLQTAVEVREQGVRLFFAAREWTQDIERRLRQLLDDSLATGAGAFNISRIADEDWAVEWKKHFKPLRVSRAFVVVPSWETYTPREQDRIIQIDPGQAFGTGHHETTRLCLEWLEDYAERLPPDQKPGHFLDVGTGSGILAIAARLLSFQTITAIDVDPQAIQVAKENAARNPGPVDIDWHCHTVSEVQGRYQVVMANIQALPLIEMAADLGDRMEEDGRLVLSGILQEQVSAVEAAYLARGLKIETRRQAGEWCLLEWSLVDNMDGVDVMDKVEL